MNRLIVFDLDDTLYLERDYVRSGYKIVGEYARRKHGVRGLFKAAWDLFASGERALIFDRVLEGKGIRPTPGMIRDLLSCYRTHAPRIRLCSDARRFLARRSKDVGAAIVTDGRPVTQTAKLRALGVERMVGEIVITGRWGRRFFKPHPRAFQWMERAFRLPGEACVYVGDNPAKDFDGPLSRGWTVRRMRRPGGLYASVPSNGVPTVQSCDELSSSLEM